MHKLLRRTRRRTRRRTWRRDRLSLLAARLLSPLVWAQTAPTFPSKAIRIIVPFSAGGTTDLLARALELSNTTIHQD